MDSAITIALAIWTATGLITASVALAWVCACVWERVIDQIARSFNLTAAFIEFAKTRYREKRAAKRNTA